MKFSLIEKHFIFKHSPNQMSIIFFLKAQDTFWLNGYFPSNLWCKLIELLSILASHEISPSKSSYAMNTDNYFAAISSTFLSRPELSFPSLFHSNDNRSNRLEDILRISDQNTIQFSLKSRNCRKGRYTRPIDSTDCKPELDKLRWVKNGSLLL